LPDPEPALEGMVRAAKPGGAVAVEDIQFTGHFSYPACPAFDRYVTLYQDVVRYKSGDPNIGPRLLGMFLDSGLMDVEMEVIQPSFREGPGKRIASVTMEHIREAVVGAGLASHEDINKFVTEINSYVDEPRTNFELAENFSVMGEEA
jgi:hypothetical protein